MAVSTTDSKHIKQILAAVIGNALEWYDFIVFGFFAVVLAGLFFPSHDESASLMLVFATFGAGFLARPLGGVVLGFIADKKGRKVALQLVILLMTIAIAIISFAPTYTSIGIAGAFLILLARLLQGFATGGEFASATAYLVEAAPQGKRGFYGSLQMSGQCIAAMLATLIGIMVTKYYSQEQINDWAWRIPFIIGLLIGPVGLYIRKHLNETESFISYSQGEQSKSSLMDLIKANKAGVIASFLATISATIYFYIILIYMPTYGKKELGLSLEEAFLAEASGLVFLIALIPIFGWLSDKYGRIQFLRFSNVLFLIFTYPLFYMTLQDPTLFKFTALQIVLCIFLSGTLGVFSTVLAEQFETGSRSTGMAVAYNIAVMTFGGFAPAIVTFLITSLNTPVAPAYYVLFGASAGFLASFLLKDKHSYIKI
jgi:MHS family proline/betaine transporter-like MFS transporter